MRCLSLRTRGAMLVPQRHVASRRDIEGLGAPQLLVVQYTLFASFSTGIPRSNSTSARPHGLCAYAFVRVLATRRTCLTANVPGEDKTFETSRLEPPGWIFGLLGVLSPNKKRVLRSRRLRGVFIRRVPPNIRTIPLDSQNISGHQE